MKISTSILALGIAALLSTPALAAHKPGHPVDREQPAESRMQFSPSGNRLNDTVSYPFRMMGRGAISVLHTPSIVVDTVKGERRLISDDGRFLGRADGQYDRDPLFK